ncbi:MAG: DUF1353 domain-containing protein [Fibrobacteria bacterium]|nr:DUF1353 domain-containing protein [Fibrobacteria bacterium]
MGEFSGRLTVEYLDGRKWVHRIDPDAPFSWQGDIGTVRPPEGMITDFATIPHIFAVVLPETGIGRRGRWGPAAVIHDALYLCQTRPDSKPLRRKEADAVLREAMRDKGVARLYRALIWGSVRVFGWIWWAWFRRMGAVRPLDAVMPNTRIPLAILWGLQDRLGGLRRHKA